MISEGNHVFSMLHANADRMDANFGHFFKVENKKKSHSFKYLMILKN